MSLASRQDPRWLIGKLAAVDSAGGLFAWRIADDATLPAGARVAITRVVLDITTNPSGACTAAVGVAANGTTSNNTLIDALDIRNGGTPAVFDNVENKGAAGKARQVATIGQFVTASVASGASAGLVGTIAIEYVPLATNN